MSSKAAEVLGHPPGVNFRPDDDELVEFFLLPRVRGEPSWFPGVVVIDDDTAANTHPSKLLERHGLAGDKDAYFFVRTADAAARQDRHIAGGGRWVSQKPVPNGACIGGQKIEWRRVNLNLQPSRGKSGGGSNGWVMHEYILTEPPCPFLKICQVTFSGHGKDSKRVPDGEPAPKRARVDVAVANNSGSSETKIRDQEPSVAAHASATDQGYGAYYFPIDQGMSASNQQLLDSTYYLAANAMPYMEFGETIQDSQHQQLDQVQHQPMNQQLQPVQSYMPADAVPCMELQERLQTTDQVIQDAQLQPVESSFCSIPSAAELFPQHGHGLDEQEKQFWSSIGVDTDNLVV
ncbi:unnamed protein product [Urochloa decumbens]|uniref:NAC domain-containing protein n=1 Tax=Urochloa decumbens TaxID=240449 RepID=A0ABC9EK37_9POAL